MSSDNRVVHNQINGAVHGSAFQVGGFGDGAEPAEGGLRGGIYFTGSPSDSKLAELVAHLHDRIAVLTPQLPQSQGAIDEIKLVVELLGESSPTVRSRRSWWRRNR